MPVLAGVPIANVNGVLRLVAWGTSNMAGYGTQFEAIPSQFATPDPKIKIYNYATALHETLVVGTNSNTREALGSTPPDPEEDPDAPIYWGCWAEFARQWRLNHPSLEVWVDQCCYGGRGLFQNDPLGRQDFNPSTVGVLSLYTDLMTGINATTAKLSELGRTVIAGAIMSNTGARDASNSQAAADAYGATFATINANIRTAIGFANAVVIFDQIDSGIVTQYGAVGATVRDAQIAYDASEPRTVKLLADNYATTGDNVHWTAAGEIAFGSDSYAAWKAAA